MEEYINNIDIQTIPAQTLAFIGDAVYNVYIRTYLSSVSTAKAGTLHKLSIKYVSAKGQSMLVDKLMDMLTDEEIAVYKRGRNTNIHSISKKVDIVEYKKSTGFEALIGYLYVKKDKERLEFLIQKCIKSFDYKEERYGK